jgi:hypothetical protein
MPQNKPFPRRFVRLSRACARAWRMRARARVARRDALCKRAPRAPRRAHCRRACRVPAGGPSWSRRAPHVARVRAVDACARARVTCPRATRAGATRARLPCAGRVPVVRPSWSRSGARGHWRPGIVRGRASARACGRVCALNACHEKKQMGTKTRARARSSCARAPGCGRVRAHNACPSVRRPCPWAHCAGTIGRKSLTLQARPVDSHSRGRPCARYATARDSYGGSAAPAIDVARLGFFCGNGEVACSAFESVHGT